MINQQLLDYIKQQLAQNINKEQIRNILMSNGWDASDIEEGFNALTPRSVPVPPTPVPSAVNSIIQPIQPVQSFINPIVNQQSFTDPKKPKRGLLFVFLLFLIIVLSGLGWFGLKYFNNLKINNQTEILPIVNQEINQTSPTQIPEQDNPAPLSDVQTWKVYQNSSLGISFTYPPDWKTTEISTMGVLLQNFLHSGDPQPGEVVMAVDSMGKIFNCSTKQCFSNISKWATALEIQKGVITKINGYDAVQGYTPGNLGIYIGIKSGDKGYTVVYNQVQDLQLNDTLNKIIASFNLTP